MTKKEIQTTIVKNLEKGNINNYENIGNACLSFLNMSGLEKSDKYEYGWIKDRIIDWMTYYEIIKDKYQKLNDQIEMINE